MKKQWNLIISLVVAILIAIFAVINVDSVKVNYLFGTAEWPLVLVILGSVLMGAVIAGGLGMVRIYHLQTELKHLKHDKVDHDEEEIVQKPNSDERTHE